METLNSIMDASVGLLLFVVAWFAHRKKMTRFACIVAFIGGLATYFSPVGGWLNSLASRWPWLVFTAVAVCVIVIVADIKGKRKGADKPALFSFFLVPIFFVAFCAAIPTMLAPVGAGLDRIGDELSQQMGR